MVIKLNKFGDMLISRPQGREAYLALKAYNLRDVKKSEEIKIDFDGVKVLTPSWADEVVTQLSNEYKKVKLVNVTKNPTVKLTLKTLREYSDLKI
jgi:hypothetical protein